MGGKHVLLAAVIVLAMPATRGHVQEIGEPGRGLELAERMCTQCHAVRKDEGPSPNENAPGFQTIASVPGMTGLALSATLNTSHRSMPNIMLKAEDQADIIAYIISLK